ncbi:hypothetical protein QQ73_16835, partial [Candidatus Endoriftia persephone str. Guaymas]|nr:hypothetical protein [Candidatus Endoriftia persephone str. Guaymas]
EEPQPQDSSDGKQQEGSGGDQEQQDKGEGGEEPDQQQPGESTQPPEDADKKGAQPDEQQQRGEGEEPRQDSQNHTSQGEPLQQQPPEGSSSNARQPEDNNQLPEDLNTPEAVDQVDQMGQLAGPDQDAQQSGTGGAEGQAPLSGGMALMEQWLEQVEGDPALLLKKQFKIEEYDYLRSRGGRDLETRPW